jgi:hypothetical protein
MIKLSYAIPIKDELNELQVLLDFLIKNKEHQDEIVIQLDAKNGSKHVEEYLRSHTVADKDFRWHSFDFENNFSKMRNHLISMCKGDYIVFIDADERVGENFIPWTKGSIEANPEIEVFGIPRINIVNGLTAEHIKKWNWRVDEKNRVNYPDIQFRIMKNIPDIYYTNKVHEQLTGYNTFGLFPNRDDISLIHIKNIKRQEQQNSLYEKLL